MKRFLVALQPLSKCLIYLLIGLLLVTGLGNALTQAVGNNGSSGPAWATPATMAVRRVSDIDSQQHEPNFLSNLDCDLLTFRLPSSQTMQTGCFTQTAFGLLDSSSNIVIFNGTDEGLPLTPYLSHPALAPWPSTLGLLILEPVSTGGDYVSLYSNVLSALQDQRNSFGQLTGKQLIAPPDIALKDTLGNRLVVNPQTLAFSSDGSWLVVETLNGSFVRINLATLDVTAFASSFDSQGSPALFKSQVAISDDGRYIAIDNDDALSLKVYDLETCNGMVVNLQPQTCAAYDYLPFVRQQIVGFQKLRHLRFINNGLLNFEAYSSGQASGAYELSPTASVTSLIDYLGLGDSYTSGEGAFDYLDGTDTADNMCHLSIHSYPLLLVRDLFSEAGGHSVACSGAVINDVGSTSSTYRGQAKDGPTFGQLQQSQAALLSSVLANYQPGYVAQQRFVEQYQPAVTTVSVGGDDIGFGDIIRKCVVPHVSLHASDNTCYNTYEDRLELTDLIDRTVPRWTALYKQLLAEAPAGQLYVVGYPQITDDKGNCALNVHLDKSELAFSEELIDYLNSAIHKAADDAGVPYVDISQALVGHRLCEAASYDVAINGLTAGTDGSVLGIRVFGKESYHPNALGQLLMEQAILKQTHNLARASSTTVGSDDSDPQAILNIPKTGRAINTIVPDDNLTAGLATPGQSLTIQVSGIRDGLRANATYTVKLDGPTGSAISTVNSDEAGDISTTITLPNDTTPGEHTLDITGENQASEPVDVTQPIYVPATDNDADGDGVPDSLDTCPGAVNSGQDSDRDGIDDTCDSFIGPSGAGSQDSSNHPNSNASSTSDTPETGGGTMDQTNNSGISNVDHDQGLMLTTSHELSTIVANFVLSTDRNDQVAVASTEQGRVGGPTRHILGAATVAPIRTVAQSSRLLVPQTPTSPKAFTKLSIINWWLWLVGLIVLWLLLAAGFCLRYLMADHSKSK